MTSSILDWSGANPATTARIEIAEANHTLGASGGGPFDGVKTNQEYTFMQVIRPHADLTANTWHGFGLEDPTHGFIGLAWKANSGDMGYGRMIRPGGVGRAMLVDFPTGGEHASFAALIDAEVPMYGFAGTIPGDSDGCHAVFGYLDTSGTPTAITEIKTNTAGFGTGAEITAGALRLGGDPDVATYSTNRRRSILCSILFDRSFTQAEMEAIIEMPIAEVIRTYRANIVWGHGNGRGRAGTLPSEADGKDLDAASFPYFTADSMDLEAACTITDTVPKTEDPVAAWGSGLGDPFVDPGGFADVALAGAAPTLKAIEDATALPVKSPRIMVQGNSRSERRVCEFGADLDFNATGLGGAYPTDLWAAGPGGTAFPIPGNYSAGLAHALIAEGVGISGEIGLPWKWSNANFVNGSVCSPSPDQSVFGDASGTVSENGPSPRDGVAATDATGYARNFGRWSFIGGNSTDGVPGDPLWIPDNSSRRLVWLGVSNHSPASTKTLEATFLKFPGASQVTIQAVKKTTSAFPDIAGDMSDVSGVNSTIDLGDQIEGSASVSVASASSMTIGAIVGNRAPIPGDAFVVDDSSGQPAVMIVESYAANVVTFTKSIENFDAGGNASAVWGPWSFQTVTLTVTDTDAYYWGLDIEVASGGELGVCLVAAGSIVEGSESPAIIMGAGAGGMGYAPQRDEMASADIIPALFTALGVDIYVPMGAQQNSSPSDRDAWITDAKSANGDLEVWAWYECVHPNGDAGAEGDLSAWAEHWRDSHDANDRLTATAYETLPYSEGQFFMGYRYDASHLSPKGAAALMGDLLTRSLPVATEAPDPVVSTPARGRIRAARGRFSWLGGHLAD